MIISSDQFKNTITKSFDALVALLEAFLPLFIYLNFVCFFKRLIKYFQFILLELSKRLTHFLKTEIFIFQEIRPSIHSVTIAPILFSINYSEA